MAANGLKHRHPPASAKLEYKNRTEAQIKDGELHPGGPIKHGTYGQALRMALLAVYFLGSCTWWVALC